MFGKHVYSFYITLISLRPCWNKLQVMQTWKVLLLCDVSHYRNLSDTNILYINVTRVVATMYGGRCRAVEPTTKGLKSRLHVVPTTQPQKTYIFGQIYSFLEDYKIQLFCYFLPGTQTSLATTLNQGFLYASNCAFLRSETPMLLPQMLCLLRSCVRKIVNLRTGKRCQNHNITCSRCCTA